MGRSARFVATLLCGTIFCGPMQMLLCHVHQLDMWSLELTVWLKWYICIFFVREHIIPTSFLLYIFYYESIKTTFRISSGQIDIFVYTFVLHFVQKLSGTLLISVLGVSPRAFWSWLNPWCLDCFPPPSCPVRYFCLSWSRCWLLLGNQPTVTEGQ